jgi:hypothetical protein
LVEAFQTHYMVAGRGCDTDAFLAQVAAMGAKAVIPARKNRARRLGTTAAIWIKNDTWTSALSTSSSTIAGSSYDSINLLAATSALSHLLPPSSGSNEISTESSHFYPLNHAQSSSPTISATPAPTSSPRLASNRKVSSKG